MKTPLRAPNTVLRIRGLAMDACDQTGRYGEYACEDAPLLSAHVAKRPGSAVWNGRVSELV
jgi:hypothetical protein